MLPLTPEHGLSQGAVRDLHIDKQGFLWIATAGGINRYDGNQIIELHTKDYRLSEISFNDILEDSQGRLWLSADNTGLYLYDATAGNFELFVTAPRESGHPYESTILAVIEYDTEHLLFVVNQAVYKLRITDRHLTKIFDLSAIGHPNGWIRSLLLSQQHLLIATFNGVIHYNMQNGTHQYLPHLPDAISHPTHDQLHTKSLYLDAEYLYVGTVSGLFQLPIAGIQAFLEQGQVYTPKQMLAERNIWHLATFTEQLHAATDTGLYRLTKDGEPEEILSFRDNPALLDHTMVDFSHDTNGGIWLANRSEGAFYWHPKSQAFQQLTTQANALSSNKITHIWPDGQALWLATTNGLNRINLQDQSISAFLVNGQPNQMWHAGNISHVVAAPNKILWLTTITGIHAFDVTQQKQLPLVTQDAATAALLGPEARAQFFDTESNTLIIKQQKHFYRYDPLKGEVSAIAALNQYLPTQPFGSILGQLHDKSWLLSAADQLWRFEPKTAALTLLYQHADFLPQLNRYATSMLYDQHGTLWIGMQGVGLLGFQADTFNLIHTFSVDNRLRSNEVFSLRLDHAGSIWFSSRQGLVRLEPTSLQLDYFSKADGLAFNEFNDGAAALLADGRLVFGGIRGAVTVTPEKLLHAPENVNVVITDFSVLAGKPRAVHGFLNNRQFTLSHNDTGLKLSFSAMSFHNNHKISYRFWLSGKQNNYYPAQFDSQVIFPQLPPGTYQFNVVAIHPLSQQESAPATLQLYIAPPLWRSPLAYLCYLLLLGSIAWSYWRKRQQQQFLLKQAHLQVKTSEQRLTQALTSVNSGVFEWSAHNHALVSSRLPRMLGTNELMHTITWQQHCSLIHPDDLPEFEQHWQRLLKQPDLWFDLTYRMRHQDGRWLWFRDQGRVTELDEQQAPLKILGTYSNITETKANEEKARLFGEAFQQTRDWVVILDNRQRVIAANHSFCQAFGGIEPYLDSPRSHHLGISLVRRRFYTKLLKELATGQHWQGEEQVITPDGRERPTLINVSAVGQHDVTFFVLVFTDITAQKAAEDELRYLANYDALTGLPNRALLMDRIQHGIEQAKRQQRSLALCFIDLDKFKHINDSLGHDIGDLMLKEVARRLKLTLRDSDTVARLGGDEFVILLEGYKNNNNISHVARKMLTVISEPMQLGSDSVGVSPSIGIAVYPDDALNGTELMKHADVAMYHAKEAGRNNFQFFIKEMNEKAHMQLARETRLRKALQQQEFVNYYQPIIDSAHQSIVGAEVLLRWQSSEGMISPAEFIPLAEDLRLIVNMTQQLLERALADVARWRAAGYELYVSVNLSTQHLEQPALAETVLALLRKYQLPCHCLRFEITESALMRDQQSAVHTMQSLSDSGIKLALDDFGTGYSSLKYLKELPLDAIKIDRSFVQDIGVDHNDETIIDAMLSMANSLGLYCVAEGVETEQQLAFFNKRSCFLIQGFLFSRPLPAAQLLALLGTEQFAVNPPSS